MLENLLISIISHNHGSYMPKLLSDLSNLSYPDKLNVKILLTINIPEDTSYLKFARLPTEVIKNKNPVGFGENHNRAFERCKSDYFLVLNPDIEILPEFNFCELLMMISDNVGVVSPLVLDITRDVYDNFRPYPTLKNLLQRKFNEAFRGAHSSKTETDAFDWIAGMFMLFNSKAYCQVAGFDTSYFMYMEDVDICRRLSNFGKQLLRIEDQEVLHHGQRQSRYKLKHFLWHFRSYLRYTLKFFGNN